MRDGHTYTIGGVNLIVPVVGLVGGDFVELVRHVIRGAGVHVPGWINRVGWCVSLLDARVLALGSDVGRWAVAMWVAGAAAGGPKSAMENWRSLPLPSLPMPRKLL